MLKISAVYLIGKAEIPIHYTIWALVKQALLKDGHSAAVTVANERSLVERPAAKQRPNGG